MRLAAAARRLGEVFFPETQNDENEGTAREEPPSPAESQTSALPENILPDFPEPDANKTEKNDTEMSETDRIYPPYTPPSALGCPDKPIDPMDGIEGYKAQIKANIGYDILVEQRPNDRKLIDGYVELLTPGKAWTNSHQELAEKHCHRSPVTIPGTKRKD